MEPFVTPATVSAGTAALDTLFPTPQTGGGQGGTPAPKQAPAAKAPATPAPVEADAPAELGAEEQPQTEEQPSEQVEREPDFIEFAVTDDQGRRKVKLDLSDREKLARILPQAFGFRKMQSERDQLQKRVKEVEPRLQELEQNWQTLERTYQEGGVEGLIDLLGGKKGHYQEWRKAEIDRELKFRGATEAEKQFMLMQEKLEKSERDNARRQKAAEELEKKAAADREAAQEHALSAQITPAFNKYRFAGTLGNEAQEQAFDQAIWDQALKNLEELPETQPLTQARIEQEFRTVSAKFKAAIGRKASAQVKQVLDTKKQDAQTRVAAAAARGTGRPGTLESNMQKNIQRGGVGGLTDALMDVLNFKPSRR